MRRRLSGAEREGAHGHSEGAATANVVKSIMGAGCFALPWAYAQTGYVFTTVYMVASAGLCMYCLNMMQRAKVAALAADPSKAELTTSYSGLAVATIGDLGGNITQLMVLVCCFGIASAYLVFVASTLATILPVSQTNLIIAITPVMVALAWLRSFSGVSLISLLGNVSVTVGMTAVLVYASKVRALAAPDAPNTTLNTTTLALTRGTALQPLSPGGPHSLAVGVSARAQSLTYIPARSASPWHCNRNPPVI